MKYVILIFIVIILIYLLRQNPLKYKIYRNDFDVSNFHDKLKTIEDVPLDVGVYKNDENIATYYSHFVNASVSDVLKESETKMQYKSNLGNDNPVDEMIRNFITHDMGLVIDGSKSVVTVRFCNAPWDFKSHFDCTDNHAFMLYGRKDFLLFDMFKHPNEVGILDDIKNLSIKDTVRVLDSYNIRSQLYTLNPGDILYIGNCMYHKVESREPSVLLNIVTPIKNKREHNACSSRFNHIWPKQTNVCRTNECLY